MEVYESVLQPAQMYHPPLMKSMKKRIQLIHLNYVDILMTVFGYDNYHIYSYILVCGFFGCNTQHMYLDKLLFLLLSNNGKITNFQMNN